MTISYDENTLSDTNAESLNWNVQDQFKGLSMSDIQAAQLKLPYAIAMLNTSGSLNIGVAIRSAVMFGCSKVYIVGKRRYDKRSTVGAHNYIDIETIDAIDDNGNYDAGKIFLNFWDDGFTTPIGVETNGLDIGHPMVKQYLEVTKPVFIFGEEQKGIPQNILKVCPLTISVPTLGVMRSLNVSVAASITMYEIMKALKTPLKEI